MTKYNTLNAKLFNFQLNKLQSGMNTRTKVTLKLSSNAVGDSNDEINFQHKLLLLTNTQVSNLRKALANYSSANIKLLKTKLHKIRILDIRRITRQTFRTFIKSWITFNRKCT